MALTTPVDVKFGEDGDRDLDKFVLSNLMALINSYMDLHRNKVPAWRRLVKGQPKDKTRDFPWPGASNVVIQLIGENVSDIKAIQLGTIYEIMPIWVAGLIGEFTAEEMGEEQRNATESFMSNMALSRDELDLYRTESKAAHDIAALGSVVVKMPWVTEVHQIVTGIDPTTNNLIESEEEKYDGPKPEKLAYEDWAATPSAQTWESAKFKYHEIRLTKSKCEYNVAKGLFDKDAWESIKNKPDLQGLTEEEENKLQEKNVQGGYVDKELDRWRFYECWLEYWHNEKLYSIIYIMHLDPQKRMKAVFNFYPKNEEPFEFGRLGYDEDGLLGYGFAEMGEMYQEDVSTKHNQRNDNHTLCNTSVVLAGNNPRVDSGLSLFPMAVLPFSKDDVSIEQLGVPDQTSVQEESMTIELAKARFGTNMMSAEGNGSGGVDKKGNYNSMGTFSIMQQGARRINVNITDFRYLHLNLGRKAQKQYAYFGVGDSRYRYLGEEGAKYLRMAMDSIRAGRLDLPIKAATASINREIEKQTGMLFSNVMQRHYGAIAQILQGVTNPVVPEPIKEYLMGSIGGMAYIMGKLLRAFGYDDILRMQPELAILNKLKGAGNGQQNVSNPQGAPQGGNGEQGIQAPAGVQTPNNSAPGAPNAGNSGGVLLR